MKTRIYAALAVKGLKSNRAALKVDRKSVKGEEMLNVNREALNGMGNC